MIDPVSTSYFTAREEAMREIGLDPNNDDEWAIPDFDFDHPVEVDGFIFGRFAEEYDFDAWALCRDCFEEYVAPGEVLCVMCKHDRTRKGLVAA